jgi:hypothetical protein
MDCFGARLHLGFAFFQHFGLVHFVVTYPTFALLFIGQMALSDLVVVFAVVAAVFSSVTCSALLLVI